MLIDEKAAEEGLNNADIEYEFIDLSDGTSITEEAAEILSSYEGTLYLTGLTELSESAAKSLSRHKGPEIELGDASDEIGLPTITDGVSEALAQYEGRLHLGGLKEMSDITAKNFGSASNLVLALPPIHRSVTVSEQGLAYLEENQSAEPWVGEMRKFRTLDKTNAEILLADGCLKKVYKGGGAPYEFYIHDMLYVTEDGAQIMAREYAPPEDFTELMLDELRFMEANAAQHLAQVKYGLILENLRSLSDDAVKAISLHKGGLLDLGIDNPSDAQLAILSEREGQLALAGLTKLSDVAAEALAQHKGDLWLENLAELSDAAAEFLSKHKGKINGEDPKEWAESLRK